MGMVRRNFYLTVEQNDFLRKQKNVKVSEHLRRAIDMYIAHLSVNTPKTSPSR